MKTIANTFDTRTIPGFLPEASPSEASPPEAPPPEAPPPQAPSQGEPPKQHPRREQLAKDFRSARMWQVVSFVAGSVVGVTSIAFYSATSNSFFETFGLLTLFAAAAALSGAFLGFLFGVPRSAARVTTDGSGSGGGVATMSNITGDVTAPNTNLESISDWLTKIIVGATLTQLGSIPGAAAALFAAMAAALGGNRPSDTGFIGGLTVFGAVFGFIFGWLVTRTYVGWMITVTDTYQKIRYRRASSGGSLAPGHAVALGDHAPTEK